MTGPPVRVAYVVRSWPRWSQTFVVAEVLAVERLGVHVTIFSRTRAADGLVQPEVADVTADVHHLDEIPLRRRLADAVLVARTAPLRAASTLAYTARRPWLTDGYATSSAARCLLDAVGVAAWLRREQSAGRAVTHVHAHFAHDPALVAMLASRLTGTPYTFTAHARDLYQLDAAALSERVAGAELVVTCCAQNAEHLARTVPVPHQRPVRVLHHGVELTRFPAAHVATPAAGDPPLVVSVGRLVEKKGFPDLLEACAEVKATGRPFRLRIYGDGPLRAALERRRSELGLDVEVEFAGEQEQPAVLAALRSADVFALTPYVTPDGDRDGIPNVLVEAMATGLPVVSTRAAGVPELVADGTSGLLAEPRDVAGIAAHLARLLDDAPTRRRLGAAARGAVEAGFDVDVAARRLSEIFRHASVPPVRDALGASS